MWNLRERLTRASNRSSGPRASSGTSSARWSSSRVWSPAWTSAEKKCPPARSSAALRPSIPRRMWVTRARLRPGEDGYGGVVATSTQSGMQFAHAAALGLWPMAPKTQYAKCGELSLAYQVVGEGAIDIVLVPSFVSHIEFFWAHPAIKSFLDRLAAFARLLIFDKAGTGLSDPVPSYRTLEERADEVEAVMDAAGMSRAVMFGLSEGGPTAIFFSVTRPERAEALVLFGTFAASIGLSLDDVHIELSDAMEKLRGRASAMGLADDEIPDEAQVERVRRFARHVLEDWGEGKALKELVPNQGDEAQLGLIERLCSSPGMARATLASGSRLDVIDLLASVDLPTLVVHARGDLVPVQGARLIARRIPGARLLEVEGVDHAPWFSSPDEIVGEIEELLTGTRHAPEPDRILATVLFTDIVGSTERAAELGDARWRGVLERHDEVTRGRVRDAGGVAVKSTGDGFLATFNGPAAAIR